MPLQSDLDELEEIIKVYKKDTILWRRQVLRLSLTILLLTFIAAFAIATLFIVH